MFLSEEKIINKIFLRNMFMSITPDISGCDNNIIAYFKGKHFSMFKNIPRLFIETENDLIPVFIMMNKVICLSKKYNKELDYVKDHIDEFKRSWYNENGYGSRLPEILSGKGTPFDMYIEYFDCDKEWSIIYAIENNLNHDIDLAYNKIRIVISNNNHVTVLLHNKKPIVLSFRKSQFSKEIEFISKYADVFDICHKSKRLDLVKNIISDMSNGIPLDVSLNNNLYD